MRRARSAHTLFLTLNLFPDFEFYSGVARAELSDGLVKVSNRLVKVRSASSKRMPPARSVAVGSDLSDGEWL